MALLSLWMATFVNLFLVIQRCCYADDCVIQYTQQPPPCLSCNPYNDTASPPQLQLTLACGAQRNDDKKNKWTFDLRWFSNYSNDSLNHVADVHTTSFTNTTLMVNFPGQYWCQVLDYTDGGPGYLLARSNVLEVLSWKWYSSFPICIENQSVMENKCAYLSPSPSASPAIDKSSVCPVLMTESITTTLAESSVMSCCSQSPSDYPSLFIPSISASSVTAESSTDVTLVLVVVMVPLLVLLLLFLAGITITLFFTHKAMCKSKAETARGPLREEATSRCPEKIYLQPYDDSSPQPVHYKQSTSLGCSLNSQAMTVANSRETLFSQATKNKVYEKIEEHQMNTEEQQQPDPPTSEYAVIKKSMISTEENGTLPYEINNPKYLVIRNNPNKGKKGKEAKSQNVLVGAPPPIPPQIYFYEEKIY